MTEFWQDPYMLSVLVFAFLLTIYVYRDRRKFERQSIILLRRTTKGRQAIIGIANRAPRFWKHLGNFGVVIGFGASIYVFFTLIENLIKAATVARAGGLAVLIPSPSATAASGPGFLAVPFWYWIIAIGLLVVVHEGLHGVMSVVGKVKIKSLGWGLLAVIPLAFVEPDEKKLAKKSFLDQQRVFAAGSLANFMLAAASLFILTVAFSGFYGEGAVHFQGYTKGYPAETANLTGDIVSIDNYRIKSIDDLGRALTEIGPGKQVEIRTKAAEGAKIVEKSFTLKTAEDADPLSQEKRAVIGISKVSDTKILKESALPYAGIIVFSQGLFFFIFLINLGVGMANLLPIKPLDGGRMWETLFRRVSKTHHKKIGNILAWLTFILMIGNFIVPLI